MSLSSSSNGPIPSGLIRRKKPGPEPAMALEGAVTLVGVVEQGVESRSIVLLDDAGSALAQLAGQPAAAYSFGSRVEVTGRFAPELRTTAQQGRPFRVHAVKVL